MTQGAWRQQCLNCGRPQGSKPPSSCTRRRTSCKTSGAQGKTNRRPKCQSDLGQVPAPCPTAPATDRTGEKRAKRRTKETDRQTTRALTRQWPQQWPPPAPAPEPPASQPSFLVSGSFSQLPCTDSLLPALLAQASYSEQAAAAVLLSTVLKNTSSVPVRSVVVLWSRA